MVLDGIRQKAKLLSRIKKARTDFRAFVQYIWANEPGFELADFHLQAIEAYADFSKKFMYWEAARGHGKSLITLAFVVWCLGRDQNHRIKLICANDKEARKRLYEIKEQIRKNTLIKLVFPNLEPDPTGEWNKSRVFLKRTLVSKDPSVEALGVMSSSLGSRATLIIFDDIVDIRNAILQSQLREHVRQKVFGEIIPLLEPEGVVRAVGTPWTQVDVNAIMKESAGWSQLGPDRISEENGKPVPIWPYKFKVKDLLELYTILGPAEFARAYRCQALTGDTVPIQGQWIKFYDANVLGDPYTMFCLQCYDLAIGQDRSHDYFGWATLLWDRSRNYVFIPEAGMGKLSFNQQAKKVVNNADIWHPQEVVIEHGGYQGALASYLEEETRSRALPIWPFRTRGRSKERRMVEASPWFEKGRVFFHPKLDPRTNPEVHYTGDPVGQITSFPFGKYDDISDAVVMGLLTITEMDPNSTPDDRDDDFAHSDDDTAFRVTLI